MNQHWTLDLKKKNIQRIALNIPGTDSFELHVLKLNNEWSLVNWSALLVG